LQNRPFFSGVTYEKETKMSTTIPDSHKELLEEPVCIVLTTVMPDGQPQSTVVWGSYDGTYIKVNTAAGRQKEKNMRQNPKVTVLAMAPENPYRYIEVRGTVEEITQEGAVDHANKLAKLYANKETYYGGVAPAEQEGKETRVVCKIKPNHVNAVSM
jgi:PPOX class probable F420-dependent enzyme